MAQDPAVLFYTKDFLSSTLLWTYEQKGKYVTLLCLQHQQKRLSRQDIIDVCGDSDTKIMSKFKEDEGGFFNQRMEDEMIKRSKHSEKQRENIMKRWNKSGNTTVLPLEDEDANVNVNRIVLREEIFKSDVLKFKNYPAYMLDEFIDYWTEPNKSGTKMLWELKQTWDLKRRLQRWSANAPLKAPVSKKQTNEIRTGKPMTQAQVREYYKEHGKYPNQ